jgi:hypothetical protein
MANPLPVQGIASFVIADKRHPLTGSSTLPLHRWGPIPPGMTTLGSQRRRA